MPQRKCAVKALRQNQKRQAHNLHFKLRMKDTLKSFVKMLGNKPTAEQAQEALEKVYKTVDQAVAKGLIHKNKSSRQKSRLTKRFLAAVKAT